MHNAAEAYGKTSQVALAPRDLEAHLLIKAAVRLQGIKDSWEDKKSDLDEALVYNQKLWTVFVGAVTGADSQLPKNIRENIANLGVFVFKRTLDMQVEPTAQGLTALIDINRNVAAGLRGQG